MLGRISEVALRQQPSKSRRSYMAKCPYLPFICERCVSGARFLTVEMSPIPRLTWENVCRADRI